MPPLFYITLGATWATHVVVSYKAGALLFMVVGALFPVIAWLHGVSIWFGHAWVN